ncbi:MAG: D-alanyl-D-alanine carboxypeptidase/D-alanyl-D-alanine-endopeptidase, partial [Bacteroidota bacterium]
QDVGISAQLGIGTSLDTPPETQSRTTFHTQHSPALLDIITRANFKSVNVYCDALIRLLGKRFGKGGSMAAGTTVVEEYWTKQGIDMMGFFMQDGSGLSPRNGVSTRQFAQLLQLVEQNPKLSGIFYETLPIGGESGTVKYLFRDTAAKGKIRLKSGSLGRVRSYSGYATAKNGRKVAFSIIANNYTCSSRTIRKKLEKVMSTLCE